jgi:hypothetical protein
MFERRLRMGISFIGVAVVVVFVECFVMLVEKFVVRSVVMLEKMFEKVLGLDVGFEKRLEMTSSNCCL